MKTLNEVEIFAAGTWNGSKFIEEDLLEIAENTNKLLEKSTHKPPVKLGHSKKQILAQNDGQPALGWLENFKVKGKKLVADLKNIPDILIDSMKKNLFKQVSIELTHHRHFGWFASGLAILGADLPAVKTLQDLQIYLSEKKEGNLPDNIEGDFVLKFSQPLIIQDEKSMAENKLSQAELELQKKELEFKEKEKELAAKLEEAEKTKQELSLRLSEVAFSEAKEKVISSFKETVTAGKLTPALFTEIEKEIDSQKTENFSEGKEFSFSAELLHKVIDAQEKKINLSETKEIEQPESSERSVDEILDELVQEKIKSDKVEYFTAMNMVFSEHPELKEEYNKFSEGEK